MIVKKIFTLTAGLLVAAFVMAQDPWKVKATTIDPQNYYGVTVANGMVGILSSPEPLKVQNILLAGTYDLYGRGRVDNFLNGFNMLNLRLSINGSSVNLSNVSQCEQELDMRNAVLKSSFIFKDEAKVTYSYLALRNLPFSVMLDVTIEPLKDVSIAAFNIMETPDALNNSKYYYNEINRKHVSMRLMTSTASSPTGKLLIAACSNFLFPEKKGEEPRVSHDTPSSNLHQMRFYKDLKAGESYTFSLVGSTISSAYHSDPYNEVERLTIFASLEGRERLLMRHKQEWDKLWASDIAIDGDAQVQQDIHSMLYHAYSFVREGSGLSMSPMGLSGLGYNGHIFWDADVWVFPALLMLHPELAKSMIEYRYNTLAAARQNAMEYGYRGAKYAWESSDNGFEQTPVWALTGPFEHHITACVALAAWNYYCVTQDTEWLKEKGWPILKATAEFWESRCEKNASGKYDIKNVVAADEWAENVDNNAFTNAAAKSNLRNANLAAKLLGYKVNTEWENIANGLVIERFADGVIREHATYNGEKIKQADVNLLAYPLNEVKDTRQIAKDLAYYEVRVPEKNTPAMTQAIFSLLYSRIGNADKALHFFHDSYSPNKLPPFGVIAETKGGDNPYFVTGAGGTLQAVMMGFCGLEITPKGIVQINSVLPSGWKSVAIKGVGVNKKSFTKVAN